MVKMDGMNDFIKPEPKPVKKGRIRKYPWMTMRVDETFRIACDDGRPMNWQTAYVIVWQANKRYKATGRKFKLEWEASGPHKQFRRVE